MGYEGNVEPGSSKRTNSGLDKAIQSWNAYQERRKNERVEGDEKYPDPEILQEDIDSLTLRMKGARQPITFSLSFEADEDHTAFENHTAFLESEMDSSALLRHKGHVARIMPHDEYDEWLARTRSEGTDLSDEPRPDASYYEPKDGQDYLKTMERYGTSLSQIDHARRFAHRHLLNSHRKRSGKPPLAKEAITYTHNFPSIAADKPAASKIIEEAREEPAPRKSWLDAHRSEF